MNTYLVMTVDATQPKEIQADEVDLSDRETIQFRQVQGITLRLKKADVLWWDISYLTATIRFPRRFSTEVVQGYVAKSAEPRG